MKKWLWGTLAALVGIVILGVGGWWLLDHYHYQQLVDQPGDVKNGRLILGHCSLRVRLVSGLRKFLNLLSLGSVLPMGQI